MAVATAAYGRYLPAIFLHSPLKITNQISRPPSPPPLYISTNPAHVNPLHLQDLYSLCNHSCHRFPNLDSHGRVEPIDVGKLSTALSHSSVIVSVFTRPEFVDDPSRPDLVQRSTGIGGDWIQKVMPVTPDNGQLVGFGRAVSDLGLAASVYDVMVNPSLQGRGIGRRIVQRIVRMLTSNGVYDISALCSDKESLTPMGKLRVEVCLISARGLRRTSSLWKLQWFGVGWIDTNNKYCTRIDSSGNANPVWKTKFSTLVDPSEPNFQDMALHVEVYSRDPVFLRERLLGTATVILKEFLEKYLKNSEVPKPVAEVGSFQLRKKNSNKPRGFVDISIQISEEREEPSYQGDHEGFNLMGNSNGINLDDVYGPLHPQLPAGLPQQPGSQPQASSQYAHPLPFPGNYSNLPTAGPSYTPAGGTSFQPPTTPPPPPPPSTVGYISTFLPRTDNLQPSYVNMPSSVPAPVRGRGPGVGMGLGAGALAAGAVIFGDDFMSGFDIPRGLQDASLTVSTDPPF